MENPLVDVKLSPMPFQQAPCPISLLLGTPIRPISPTHDGGNEYCSMSPELDSDAEYLPSKGTNSKS